MTDSVSAPWAEIFMAPQFRGWLRQMGGAAAMPDIMRPGGDYDYPTAVRAGVTPQPYDHDGGAFHWPSVATVPPRAAPSPLKGADHRTGWMEVFSQMTGADPWEATTGQWQQGAPAVRQGVARAIGPSLR